RIGLTAAETLALGSPFDYAHQVTIHIPRNLPDPSDQPNDFEQEAIRAVAHYLERTHGKAFVLFTSYKMLEATARPLTPSLGRPGWPLGPPRCSPRGTACRAPRWWMPSRPTSTA